MTEESKKIFLKLEKVNLEEVQLETAYQKDEENFFYIAGIASTPDVNSYGYIVESSALLESWEKYKAAGKNVAVYEKHGLPIGKVVVCELKNENIIVLMECPKRGNARVQGVYEQGIYTGLSIGGWRMGGFWDDEEVWHVTKFEWYEVSLTDIPANESAILLEGLRAEEAAKSNASFERSLNSILESIRGI